MTPQAPVRPLVKALQRLSNLPKRNLLLISVALTGLLGAIYVCSAIALEQSIRVAEKQSAEQAVESVRGLLKQTYTDFTDRFPDWSAWDDTYEFITDRNSDYIKSNLAPESLARMNVNVVLYYNLSGEQVYGVGVDVQSKRSLPVPPQLEAQISPLLRAASYQRPVTGLIMLPRGPLLVTAQPILTTLGEGPVQGTIIFGRYLDINRLQRLAQRYELTLYRRDQPLPLELDPVVQGLTRSQIAVYPRTEEIITGYANFNDIYNNPALLVQVDAPRDIYQQGKVNLHNLLIALCVVGGAFWLVALLLLMRQSRLYQQVQQLNADLEFQVEDRTLQLIQSLNFEALLKRITDKVRDSLDEQQILQTAVEELAGLDIECCDTAIYDLAKQTSAIVAEYAKQLPPAQGAVFLMSEYPDLYQWLMREQYLHCCFLHSANIRSSTRGMTVLACPMSDDRGVIGDLWLYRQSEPFQMAEIRLVQQVANQCAIAIRQARLYQAAQAQVTELERLNRLKDDFLNTVSHEMRTPMSSIKMAIQMLEISLESGEDNLAGIRLEGTRASRYFKILQDQCDREIGLINNLLDLSRLEAGGETLSLSTIEPHGWLAQVVEPFIDRTRRQQQRLTLAIEAELPKFSTDLSKLERIVTELLNNACKYTPAEQEIELTVRSQADTMLIFRVTNSGVQLDPVELTRIFDKFYRIPRHDPWNHGGTGLGLALVKKLVAYLGGWIQVGQGENQIWFQVELPSLPMEGTVAVKKTPD